MLCPICKTELIVTGQDRLETLSEHVCDPNGTPSMKDKYECPNTSCKAFKVLCWNDWGERYGSTGEITDDVFIGKNDAPFGSFQRKANVEISKKDENHALFGIETRWGALPQNCQFRSNFESEK